jgi:serine/threonine-protein kinase
MSDKQRIGKYEIVAPIGKGSSGVVYRAFDGERTVALKLVDRGAVDAPALDRLRRAAERLARLQHPAIASFIALIETGQAVGLVSELAPGESLAVRLNAGNRFDLRQTWEIARQLLSALGVAHAKAIVHGDLKPGNLVIDKQDVLKVTDFGIGGLVAGVAGTPFYMAPEQFGHGEPDVHTDLYQVGAIVYHLVTGKLPFTGTREEVTHCVIQERPSDPSSIVPKLAWQLDWVIQRALSKDPADRFGSAREFLDGLRLGLQESIGAPLPMPTPAPAAGPSRPAAGAARATTGAQPATAAKAPPPGAPPEVSKPRVLFVDDDERVLNALRALFRPTYEVSTAASGALALEIVRRSEIQILVSDQRMPGMTGVELLRQVKKESPRTVRVLLTGYSDLAALVGSVNEGEIFRFVKKPWDNEDIRATLAEAAEVAAKLSSQATAAKAQSPRSTGSLLVIDPGGSLAKGLERLLSGAATVHLATSARDAAKILQTQDVACVVADLAAGKEGLVALFKLLKAKRPETLSILVADDPDSEVVAELVNQARIYRFLAKPVNARELRSHVSEALRRYAAFKESRQRAKDSGLVERGGAAAGRPASRTA